MGGMKCGQAGLAGRRHPTLTYNSEMNLCFHYTLSKINGKAAFTGD